MSVLKKVTAAAALLSGMAITSAANAAFIPFYFDPTGSGTPAGIAPEPVTEFERLVVSGGVNVEVTGFNSPTEYTFDQSADFDVLAIADPTAGLCGFGGCQFTAELSGASGTADLTSGQATFTGGTISLVDALFGTIATFDIIDGGVGIDNTGVPIPGGNNESSIIAVPTFFQPGYFFFDELGAEDFADATFGTDPGEIDMSLFINLTLSDVEVETVSVEGQDVLSEISFTADGSARFEVPVPAPASLALFSLGLLGLGAVARKRKKKLTIHQKKK